MNGSGIDGQNYVISHEADLKVFDRVKVENNGNRNKIPSNIRKILLALGITASISGWVGGGLYYIDQYINAPAANSPTRHVVEATQGKISLYLSETGSPARVYKVGSSSK